MKFYELFYSTARFCMKPEDGDGGDAGGGAGDGGQGDDKGAGGDDGGQDDPLKNLDGGGDDNKGGSLLDDIPETDGLTLALDLKEKPEGLDDAYWDVENEQLNVQKLFEDKLMGDKRVKDLRDKIAKGQPKAPEKAEDYTIELAEELKEFVTDDDPLMAKARERAHELGISQDVFQDFVGNMIGDMVEIANDMADNPKELTDEQKAEMRDAEYAKIGPNAPAVIRAVETWANELKSKGMFSEQDIEAYKSMAVTGDQVRVLNKFRALMGGNEIPMDMTDDGLPSDEEIYAKYVEPLSDKHDPALEREYEGILQKRREAGRPETLQLNV